MEPPYDPISQLASCCFGRRPRSSGFKTEAIRNQYYYSPSMAHIGPGNTTTWPMAQTYGPAPFALTPSQPQPYILFTQPMIITTAGNPAQHSSTQAIPLSIGAPIPQQQQVSPLHKVPSMAASQYAIYATTGGTTYAQTTPYLPDTIYASPKPSNGLARNRGAYLGPIAESFLAEQQQHQLQQQQRHYAMGDSQAPHSTNATNIATTKTRGLTREIFKRLEIIEKQIDLTRDMDLVERHGLVITRAIEARSLAPHLTDEMLIRYQEHFLMNEEYVIRFIEIIKRPGQTLGLYIRLVHFETRATAQMASREGIVITKIESNSPVYTSHVLHIGDEILSINLIDIQGMSLDDVVTLMSIPKRLVLALRIPRGRDPQLRATYALNPHHQSRPIERESPLERSALVNRPTGSMGEEEFEYAQPARVAARQQFQRQEQEQQQRAAARSASQLNFSDQLVIHETYPSIGQQQQQQQQQPFESPGEERMLMRPSDFTLASRSMQQQANNSNTNNNTTPTIDPSKQTVQTGSILTNEAIASNPRSHFSPNNNQGPGSRSQVDGPIRMPLSHFERQLATTQSIEERPGNSDSDRFRNFSVDAEIASLEREAMNKERPALVGHDREMPMFNERVGSLSGGTGPGGQSDSTTFAQAYQGPSTLPRRALPNRPDLDLQNMSDELVGSSLSPSRRPLINNIRLGETSEQSSYFSSSIDAINRELKELRRQRMALGDNGLGVSEEISQDSKPLD